MLNIAEKGLSVFRAAPWHYLYKVEMVTADNF